MIGKKKKKFGFENLLLIKLINGKPPPNLMQKNAAFSLW